MNQTSESPGDGLSSRTRIALFALGLLGLVLLVVARSLEPDPRGFGTHEQLGLSPCYLHRRVGLLCPSCGMTTAWTHTLRGEFWQAARANLGGALLCGATVFLAPWLMLSGFAGRLLGFQPRPVEIVVTATVWVVIVILDWLQRWVLN